MCRNGWIASAGRWARRSGLGGWLLVLALGLHLDLDLPRAFWMAADLSGGICTTDSGRTAPAGHHDHQDCPLCHGAIAMAWLGATPPALPLPARREPHKAQTSTATAPERPPAPVYRSRAPPPGLPLA
jgi:hypothetical protein